MMDIVSVLLVGSIVSYLMYKNINTITEKLDENSEGGYERFAAFAALVIDEIRQLKRDLDDEIKKEHPIYRKKEGMDTRDIVKKLGDLIRQTSFYETVLAKRKPAKEAEAELAEILLDLDRIIREYCESGDVLADRLREKLQHAYEEL